ncbi:MAG: hypothetical protein ACXW0Q_05735 [Methylovulum sp.]
MSESENRAALARAVESLKQYHASPKIRVSDYHFIAAPEPVAPVPKPDQKAVAQIQIASAYFGMALALRGI